MNETYAKLQPYLEKSQALGVLMGIVHWDSETAAPKGALQRTTKAMGLLSMESYNTIINPEVKALLAELKDATDLDPIQAKIVKNLQKRYDSMEKTPPTEHREWSELMATAGPIWTAAKHANDYEAFKPTLTRIIEMKKKLASYQAEEGQALFDVMLDQYEEGSDMKMLDEFFSKMRAEIVPLLKKIREKGQVVDKSFMYRHYPVEKQKEFCRFLAEYIGFDFNRGGMAEGEHPVTTHFHNHDVRFTNHYYENNLESALFSTVHEGGHALYEQGISDEISVTSLGHGASSGMHESQSRFMENVVGRNPAFWEPIYDKLVATFPEQLADVDLDRFVKAINYVEPGLVRIQADELTYCLHIMVRYEMDRRVIEEGANVDDLPQMWNDLYEEYLGIRPENDTEGVLQDVHWSMGYFGYFPTYAVGNAIAAQIYNTMKKEMDFDQVLRDGELYKIREYLNKHIHQYGKLKNTEEMLIETTGEPFNADYYVQYLKEKFTKVYGLE